MQVANINLDGSVEPSALAPLLVVVHPGVVVTEAHGEAKQSVEAAG